MPGPPDPDDDDEDFGVVSASFVPSPEPASTSGVVGGAGSAVAIVVPASTLDGAVTLPGVVGGGVDATITPLAVVDADGDAAIGRLKETFPTFSPIPTTMNAASTKSSGTTTPRFFFFGISRTANSGSEIGGAGALNEDADELPFGGGPGYEGDEP